MNKKKGDAPLVIDDLHKSFGDQVVLNGINLQVASGETVAKLIIGLQAPDSDSVRVSGQEITGLDTKQLNEVRKRVGFLFQQAALYDSLTVQDNVAFPLSRHMTMSDEERKSRAKELLANVGMDRDIEKMPSEISGGMQKRVGLARALALDPEILLFDEPTAGLDPITAAEIGKLILDLKKKRKMTAVVVTHDVRGAKAFSDRVVLMDKGNIVAEGTFADLHKSRDK